MVTTKGTAVIKSTLRIRSKAMAVPYCRPLALNEATRTIKPVMPKANPPQPIPPGMPSAMRRAAVAPSTVHSSSQRPPPQRASQKRQGRWQTSGRIHAPNPLATGTKQSTHPRPNPRPRLPHAPNPLGATMHPHRQSAEQTQRQDHPQEHAADSQRRASSKPSVIFTVAAMDTISPAPTNMPRPTTTQYRTHVFALVNDFGCPGNVAQVSSCGLLLLS